MELRIVGTEQELAEFLKALGNGKVIAKTLASSTKPKKTVVKPKLVTTKHLADKYGITQQAIRNYAKAGMPYKMVDNSYRYNETDACKWINNYMKEHESKSRGKKYHTKAVSANAMKQIKNESEYTKWKSELTEMCRSKGKDEGKMLSLVFKYMTKNYGVVWDQVKKDFKATNGYYPQSTTRMAYWLELNQPVHKNLVAACLDTVLKEGN